MQIRRMDDSTNTSANDAKLHILYHFALERCFKRKSYKEQSQLWTVGDALLTALECSTQHLDSL